MRSLEEINWENNNRQQQWDHINKNLKQYFPGTPIADQLPQAPLGNLKLTQEDKDFLKSIGIAE